MLGDTPSRLNLPESKILIRKNVMNWEQKGLKWHNGLKQAQYKSYNVCQASSSLGRQR